MAPRFWCFTRKWLLNALPVPIWAPSSRIRHRKTCICHRRNPFKRSTCLLVLCSSVFTLWGDWHYIRALKSQDHCQENKTTQLGKRQGLGRMNLWSPTEALHRDELNRFQRCCFSKLWLCLTSQDSVKAHCCSSLQIQVLSYLSQALWGSAGAICTVFLRSVSSIKKKKPRYNSWRDPSCVTAHYQREMGEKLYQMKYKTFPSLALPCFYPPSNLTFFFSCSSDQYCFGKGCITLIFASEDFKNKNGHCGLAISLSEIRISLKEGARKAKEKSNLSPWLPFGKKKRRPDF